jgi:hypothetical protein
MRTTRRNRHVGRRHTKKQRGGAPFYTIPQSRMEDWRAAIGDKDLTESLQTLFENREALAGREEEVMNHYVNILERQDDLFAAALDIIRKKLAITTTDDIITRADAIDVVRRREEFMPYLDDVENLINFVVDETIDRDLGATKLQQIRSTDEPLSTLLLFPARLQNVFIQSLARICVELLKDGSILAKLTSPGAQTILAEQYKAYTHSTAYQLSARDLRDGFFLNQGVSDFKGEVNKFWSDFISELVKLPADKDSLFRQAAGCPRSLKAVSWGYIAAHVYGLAKLGSLDELLSMFSEKCATDAPLSDAERTHIPNTKYDAIVVREGPTFGALMSNLDDTTLQFILQLSYTIKKIRAEAQTSSQETAGSTT